MFGDTPLIMVEDQDSLLEAVRVISTSAVIGVDTESDSFHHYQEKVCLIQISDLQSDYIIDPLKVDDLSPLGPMLANPEIVKILHGADYDIVCLQRDYGFTFDNIFDTMMAAQFLGYPRIGLADLIKRFFGNTIDKKYQRHDWAHRPLEDEHLQYARGDTHWLPALREVLTMRLEQAGRIRALKEECDILQERKWTGPTADAAPFYRVKGSKVLDQQGLKVLRSLWELRDRHAQQLDRPVFKVMPGPVLLELAQVQPTSEDELAKVLKPRSALMRRYGSEFIEAVKAGLADERPVPPRPKASKGKRRRDSSDGGPGIDTLLGPLKNWRNHVVSSQSLAPVVVANNQLLKEIARAAPTDLESLAKVPGVRQWQLREYGEELVDVVSATLENRQAAGTKRRRRRKRGGAAS